MSNYTIHCAGFDQAQQLSIAAILDLADSALSHSWSITESTDSDIVMINMQEEKELRLAPEYDSLAEYRIILVAENSQESFQRYWFLEKKEHAPPSLRALVDLLNQVGVCLVEAAASEQIDILEEPVEAVENNEIDDAAESLQKQEAESLMLDMQKEIEQKDDLIQLMDDTEASNIVVPDDSDDIQHDKPSKPQRKLSENNYFFGLLVQANKEKKYRIINLNQLPALYLAPEDNAYFSAGTEDELLQYCLVIPQRLSVKVLSRAKFNKALKAEPSSLDHKELKSLISFATIHVSQGQLLDGHSAKQRLKLRQMPDIEDDSILSRYKDIAEFMYQQEGNLFDVADELQVPLSDVFDFYNVCYLLGYIKVAVAGSKDLDTDNSRTLGRYLKSFFSK